MLKKIQAFIAGKKSYICAGLILAGAVVEFVAKGDFSVTALVAFGQQAGVAGAIAAIRSAIKGVAVK